MLPKITELPKFVDPHKTFLSGLERTSKLMAVSNKLLLEGKILKVSVLIFVAQLTLKACYVSSPDSMRM